MGLRDREGKVYATEKDGSIRRISPRRHQQTELQ